MTDKPLLKLTNSRTRQKEPFEPQDPSRVTLYVCGPTVYNYAHIGNARPAVVFDVLARLLRHLYPTVVYARNITDIEDKIIAAAKVEGVETGVITARYAAIYNDDMGALGVQTPDVEPWATESMPAMIDMIGRLMAEGHAYEAEGHVLFNVPSYPDYGALSGRNRDDMVAGARVEVAPYKRDPADFVLWKPSSPEMPGWESPWGRGRPGWHIECSAMIEQHLGETVDIHGGGQDLLFPHHENEAAQSVCSHGGAPLARYWMHNGFLSIDTEKMSKSLGNVLLVHDLLEKVPGEALRLVLLGAHYRAPLDWNDEVVHQAKRSLDRLYGALRTLADVPGEASPESVPDGFLAALCDDLNTPKAMAELFALAREAGQTDDPDRLSAIKSGLLSAGTLMGILGQSPEDWFASAPTATHIDGQEVEALIAARAAARKAKDFAEADRIRDALAEMGVEIEDGPDGTRWRAAG